MVSSVKSVDPGGSMS